MTQKEFEDRTKREITAEDYCLVQNLYMATGGVDKDGFCKDMRAMCAYNAANGQIKLRHSLKKIGWYIGATDAKLNFLKKKVKGQKEELAEFLVGKASAYDDSDFYKEAVKLIGQRGVVLMKMRMDLPLWDEDKQFIQSRLEE